MKLSMNRLRNRLLAFRDEHLKLDILPMLREIADITCLNRDATPDGRHKGSTNFDYSWGTQKVMNESTQNKEVEMTIFLIKGTVITHYNRETAQRIQNGSIFMTVEGQSQYLLEQKQKYAPQFESAYERYKKFMAVGETDIPDLASTLSKSVIFIIII